MLLETNGLSVRQGGRGDMEIALTPYGEPSGSHSRAGLGLSQRKGYGSRLTSSVALLKGLRELGLSL